MVLVKTYYQIRRIFSKRSQGHISKLLIKVGIKPSYNKKAKSPFTKGVIIFSADFEMAWAFRFAKEKQNQAVEIGLHERKQVPIFLSLFDEYNIPVTWATVGHLFLYECSKNGNGFAHPQMKRPSFFENRNWCFQTGDWYQHDPCTDYFSDPAWYAGDLIEQILGVKTKHEIACHTFSHIDFTDNNCPNELAVAELDACIKLAANKGIVLKSMIFPGGTAGNYEILKEKGFLCYRRPMKYHIDIPDIDRFGLVAIPSSLGLEKDPYGWTKEFHLSMLRKYLSIAAKQKMVCHFWFHPSMNDWYLHHVMPEVLQMTAELKDTGKIEVLTMQQLAERYLSLRS